MPPPVVPGDKAQQKACQQSSPYLPAHGVLAVAEEVRQLQRLPDFPEEHLHAPAALAELADGGGGPFHVAGDEGHGDHPPLDLHLRPHQPQLLGIVLPRADASQPDALVGQDTAAPPGVLAGRMLSHIPPRRPRLRPGFRGFGDDACRARRPRLRRGAGDAGRPGPSRRLLSHSLIEHILLWAGHP